ncbi:ubiquitin carboxyl-terminal hydrolase, family 1 [Parathielavia hyrcaniae]|uniref:Ubiquitin carboxyl-terminal hydrolase n=1 Tax=Parathielavia hyrcaniae TaxID=113614 RepID=A0AAN6T287_9PEZI|nr:ubiquitin carboxyl-terminal hydrolase, family 1 [Parathielavia hyrcaniae]
MSIYRKHFIPLESSPDVFNELLDLLGVLPSLRFEDVLALDGPHDFPRPVLALILVMPTTDGYESRKAVEDVRYEESGSGLGEDIVWYKQTINNACGLYAILHALSNGVALDVLGTQSPMANIIKDCSSRPPDERVLALEDSTELDDAYAKVALQGTSRVPDNAEDEVDFHYVCFVKSQNSGRLYELDGDRRGPVDRGLVLEPEEDVLAPRSVNVVQGYMEREQGNMNFSLMALVRRET